MREFFRKKQYKIAAVCVAAAVLGAVGIYAFTGNNDNKEEPMQQIAQEETEEKKTTITAKNETDKEKKEEKEKKEQKAKEEEEQTKVASAVVRPTKKTEDEVEKVTPEEETEVPQIAEAEPEPEPAPLEETEETVETAAVASNAVELHFDTNAGMSWPVSGAVILNYSMDKTVYFSTLDQYKYNPAVIIAGNVNEKVKAAADGKITDISTNEVTGCTVTMDLGDGYTAIYGQLKEVPYNVGAYVEAGNTIGFVNEPTKYYSLEGSNLYFELQKDGSPVDPVEYFSAE